MASTLTTPVAQAISLLFDGNLGRLLNYGLRPGYGLLGVWNPLTLFTNNEQGVWYDPSDLSTMFQDAAGTIPVTAVEQPVGLILDKSRGLVLGPELVSDTGFDNPGYWTAQNGWVVVDGKAIATNAPSLNVVLRGGIVEAGKVYQVTYTVVVTSGSCRLESVSMGYTGITRASSGTYTELIRPSTGTTGNIAVGSVGGFTGTIDNISVRELPGNHATQATVPKRPILRIDGNGKYYLKFDGVDDAMYTSSINFTGTDKMTVFAGVRKLSDAATGVVCELSESIENNVGSFGINAPSASGIIKFGLNFRGTNAVRTIGPQTTAFNAPFTAVDTAILSISEDIAILRLNGIGAASSSVDQGTGNYGNYPLFIGSRGGIVFPFNGHLYSLIIRGAQSSEAQILSAETYCNQKTGAY